ncbi:MAG: hypothetical protein HY910_13020 [Desulfarculus sp.]|nr:hypothetical protein [Desulfarculus sp.]
MQAVGRRFWLTWNLVILSVICDAVGIFIIKLALNDQGAVPVGDWRAAGGYYWALLIQPRVLLGGAMFLAAPFCFAAALTRMDISVAYPVQVGLVFACLLLLSVGFLGESLGLSKILGLCLVAGSLFFLCGGQGA